MWKRPAPIEGLVFDMDGLLVNSEKIVQRSWAYAGEILGYPRFGSHIYHTIGMNLAGRTKYFQEHVSKDFPMEKFTVITREKFHEIVDKEGLDIKPGARILLFAKEHGLKTGLATSFRRQHAQENLTRLWVCLCILMVSSVEIWCPRVNRRRRFMRRHAVRLVPIRNIQLRLEIAPSGVQSAHAAGMHVIMIPDMVEPSKEQRNFFCYSFDTLFDVIKMLEAILV